MALVRDLRAAGLNNDQIVAVIEAEQEAELGARIEKMAARREIRRGDQRRYRERLSNKINECVTSVTVTAVTPILPTATNDGWPIAHQSEFWAAYPRRIGKAAAFRRLDGVRRAGVPWERLMEGVRRYAEYAKTQEIQFVKHPATWLNQGCWDDELVPAEFMRREQNGKRTVHQACDEALERLRALNGSVPPDLRNGASQGSLRLLPAGRCE